MRNLMNISTIAILILTLPIAALADLSGTKTLSANTALSLDTGDNRRLGWRHSVDRDQPDAARQRIGI